MTTWRAEVPSMLSWMTPPLARAAQQETVTQQGNASTLAANTSATGSVRRTHTP